MFITLAVINRNKNSSQLSTICLDLAASNYRKCCYIIEVSEWSVPKKMSKRIVKVAIKGQIPMRMILKSQFTINPLVLGEIMKKSKHSYKEKLKLIKKS